jgi:hypothetical protein
MGDNLTPFEETNSDRSHEPSQDVRGDSRSDAQPSVSRPRRWRDPGSWIGGAILVILGLALLARNMGLDLPVLQNWWALFILIPAVGSLSTAWSQYQRNGRRLTRSVMGSLVGGLVMLVITSIFLFGLSWDVFLPAILILAGLGTLLVGLLGS